MTKRKVTSNLIARPSHADQFSRRIHLDWVGSRRGVPIRRLRNINSLNCELHQATSVKLDGALYLGLLAGAQIPTYDSCRNSHTATKGEITSGLAAAGPTLGCFRRLPPPRCSCFAIPQPLKPCGKSQNQSMNSLLVRVFRLSFRLMAYCMRVAILCRRNGWFDWKCRL
jgi:hypothetical protein